MLLEIHGHNLPGRFWRTDDEPYENVHVGVQVRSDTHGLVRGDAASATWTVPGADWLILLRSSAAAAETPLIVHQVWAGFGLYSC